MASKVVRNLNALFSKGNEMEELKSQLTNLQSLLSSYYSEEDYLSLQAEVERYSFSKFYLFVHRKMSKFSV